MSNNGWAAKVALDKKMKRESAASYRQARDLKRKAERDGTVTKRERRERPATAERRERKALYGKYNPAWGVSECCFMILSADGHCTGCGEMPWYVEALRDMETPCDMSQTEFERTASMLKAAGL